MRRGVVAVSFDDAVRALARRKGHDVSDTEPVKVLLGGEWSGFSGYTITNTCDQFTVRCGLFEGVYENEYGNREWVFDPRESRWREAEGGDQFSEPTKTALAKLWDDLKGPAGPPEDLHRVYWRDCDCEWLTKFCDENHVRHATVPGSLLRNHIADVAAQRVAGYRVGVADAERKIYVPGSEALAEERKKARAPFLRLAELIERPLLSERESGCVSERTQVFQDAAALIRAAAEDQAEVLDERGTCGDTLPIHTSVTDTQLASLAVCELPPGHNGWHQMTDDPAHPPIRWASAEAGA